MTRHYDCKKLRPELPILPASHLQAFSLLKRLADLEPGERMPITQLEGPYGNPKDVVRRLRCRYGWDIETTETESEAETRVTEGFYYLTEDHYWTARALFDAYYALQSKGGSA